MDNLREKLALHYQEDIPDEDLLDEAIMCLETYFSYMGEREILSFSRQLAIPYLALTYEKGRMKQKPGDKEDEE